MNRKLECILIIDDNQDDNFYHTREIKKELPCSDVIIMETAIEALKFLKSVPETFPDLIFLDINMPAMNGWEFLEEYITLENDLPKSITIIMLSTSDNMSDIERAKSNRLVHDYVVKPLSRDLVKRINEKYFL